MMNESEIEKFRILLRHWIEHNQEHGEEFKAWAEKAKSLGKAVVQEDMLEAARLMDKSSETLNNALKKLNDGKL